MVYDYEDEFGDDDEEPWDADLDPKERLVNPSAESVSEAIAQLKEEAEEEAKEEDPALDGLVEEDEDGEDADADGEYEDAELEYAEDNGLEGEYEEDAAEEDGSALSDFIVTPAPRVANIARLRGKIPERPSEEPEETEEPVEEFEDEVEEEEMVAPAPRVRQPVRRPAPVEVEEEVSEPEEPMYDETGLGGLANAIVKLFSRKRK